MYAVPDTVSYGVNGMLNAGLYFERARPNEVPLSAALSQDGLARNQDGKMVVGVNL